ncbi:MAG: 5'-3' exonuclease H3TH domain-containing protein [Candidatus Gracilibacteria bacterium]|nr:5'-3' exonuclease H3TH domain-containing protein [Candidatus Gracilibacteria bacterium]
MRNIYLIDGYNLIYRLFYAIPPFTTKAGEPVNAVFGMAKSLMGMHQYEKPDLLYFIMDYKGKTFREELYPAYKGTRDRMPDDLKSQEPKIFELLKAMEIPVLEKEGFEADDIIGTLATTLRKDPNNQIYIISGDKDLYQFIGGNVMVYDTMKRKIAYRDETIEKFGVPPERVVDYLSITGDSSDNIPGIAGFGPKKAQALIGEFGSLEQIYEALDQDHPSITGKTKTTLMEQREVAFLSKKLASIPTDVPMDMLPEASYIFRERSLINPEVRQLFRTLEFKSLIPEDDVPLKDFASLGIKPIHIADLTELDKLTQEIQKQTSCSIGTISSDYRLTGISMLVGEQSYILDFSKYSGKVFLETLLSSDIEIIGYDLKEELKLLYGYIKNSSQGGEEQIGLIF